MFKNRKMNRVRRLLKRRMVMMLKKGEDKEKIIEKAKKVGWNEEIINEIFKEIDKKDEIEITIPLKKKKDEEEPEEEIEEEPKEKKGLVSQLSELNEKMDIISKKGKTEKKLKKKRLKIPFKVRSKLKKLAIKNKAMVLMLQGTRSIEPVLGERKAGMLLVGDKIYDGAVECTWLWRGKYPTFIVADWDLKPLNKDGINRMRIGPLSAAELYQDTIDNHRSLEPQQIILRAMEAKENLMLKGKTNMKAIILTVVVVIIIMAVLFGGGIV